MENTHFHEIFDSLTIGRSNSTSTRIESNHLIFMDLSLLHSLFPSSVTDGLEGIAVFEQRPTEIPSHLNIHVLGNDIDTQVLGTSFSFLLMAMAGLMSVVCFFIVMNALHMMMSYRKTTIIRLQLLGISHRYLVLSLIFELSVIAALAAILGCLIGVYSIQTYANLLEISLSTILRSNILFSALPIWSVSLFCTAISLIAVWLLSLAVFSNVFRSERHRNNNTNQVPSNRLNVHKSICVSIVFFMISLVSFQFHTRELDLLAVSSFLLGSSVVTANIIPYIFQLLAKLMKRHYPITHWSLCSGIALSRDCRLAATAYFIALASAIGLATMVSSFRAATDTWLNQRLNAPAYVYWEDSTVLPNIDSVRFIERKTGTALFQQYSISMSSYPSELSFQKAMMLFRNADDVWLQFTEQNGVLINQQMAYRFKLQIGNTISLSTNKGELNGHVAGIYYDFGNPNSEVLVSEQHNHLLTSTHPAVAILPLNKQKPKKEDKTNTATTTIDWNSIKQTLHEVAPQSRFIFKDNLINLSMATFDQTFILTDLVVTLALCVSALSFAITITLLSRHIDSQLNALQSVGFPFGKIRLAVVQLFALICFIVTLIGLPVGLILAHLLINKVNVNAFGWSYPFSYSTREIGNIAGYGFLFMFGVCAIVFWRRHINVQQIRFTINSLTPLAIVCLSFLFQGCSEKHRNPIFGGMQDERTTTLSALNEGQAEQAMAYSVVKLGSRINLPEDHAAHPNYQVEWWYLTSLLRDAEHNTYPFQFTVFRFNQNNQQRYMFHASLHNFEQHWFEERFADETRPYFNLSSNPFLFSIDDWIWSGDKNSPFPSTLDVTWWQGPQLTLSINTNKPAVLHGDHGVSAKSPHGELLSYYYSFPFLTVKGTLKDKHDVDVEGLAWYDHEWTSQLIQDDVEGWDWFSIHLNNGEKVMVFRMRVDGKPDYFTGSYISVEGEMTKLNGDEFSLKPTKKLEGIPVAWKLDYPSKQIQLTISAIKQDQWNCGQFKYYEGGVNVSGSHNGEGFMELTGYVAPSSSCD